MRKYLLGSSLLSVMLVAPAHAGEIKFKPLIDLRLRYETVDQAGPLPITTAQDANSVTARLRSGFELTSGPFSFLTEAEGTLAIVDKYNSGVNGKTTYPTVADPQNIELNRIQLQYKTKPLTLTVGRQRINLDDQRFVGSVGWRQNEQTFDAVRFEYTGIKNVKADVTYAWSDRTIWGIDGIPATANAAKIDGDNIFATLSYKHKIGTLTGFAYLVDQDGTTAVVARRTSQTYGARFAGSYAFSKQTKLGYAASYAQQKDNNANPINYKADYIAAELALESHGFKLTGGYEELGADAAATGIKGGFAFQTPLATLHKFNGWADKFLTTPNDGLRDYYGGIGYTLPKVGKMGPLSAQVVYHKFTSDLPAFGGGRVHFGNEWDAQLTLKVDKRIGLTAKYADYDADKLLTNTRKIIFQIDYIY
jgi:Alginate export